MSWSIRDHRQGATETTREPAPPQTFHDDEPLPTYMAGLDDYDETAPTIPLWQRQTMRQHGLLTDPELDRWRSIMQRGIEAL